MKKRSAFCLALLLLFLAAGCTDAGFEPAGISIKLTVDQTETVIDLYHHSAAEDFAALLPLTLQFEERNAPGRTAPLPNRLFIDSSTPSPLSQLRAGGLAYSPLHGSLILMPQNVPFEADVIALGKFRDDAFFSAKSGTVSVTLDRLQGGDSGERPDAPDSPSLPDPEHSESEHPGSDPSGKPDPETEKPENNPSAVKLRIGGTAFLADLAGTEAAQAFARLLPLTLDMREMPHEKYFYLDTELPVNSFRPGTIHNGDILLYGSNCLVLFYETFSSPYSYTSIGRIRDTTGLAEALGRGNAIVSFSLL